VQTAESEPRLGAPAAAGAPKVAGPSGNLEDEEQVWNFFSKFVEEVFIRSYSTSYLMFLFKRTYI
jgi:hypothetical protein